MYVKRWFLAPIASEAMFSDLTFYKQCLDYTDQEIGSTAIEKFLRSCSSSQNFGVFKCYGKTMVIFLLFVSSMNTFHNNSWDLLLCLIIVEILLKFEKILQLLCKLNYYTHLLVSNGTGWADNGLNWLQFTTQNWFNTTLN